MKFTSHEPSFAPLPPLLQALVDRELQGDEKPTWIGQPVPKFFTTESTGLFFFGLPFTLISLVVGAPFVGLFYNADPDEHFIIPLLICGCFLAVGGLFLLSPLWAYRKARRTVYVITNQRAVSIEGGWATTIRSFPPQRLHDTYRKEYRDGTGDIVIANDKWRDSDGDPQLKEVGFFGIAKPKQVEAVLKNLAKTQAS